MLRLKGETIRSVFVFGVVTAVVLTCLGMYSLIAGLTAMQTLLLLSGSLIVTWTILFTVLEILRLAGRSRIVEDEDLEIPRVLIVQPSTGDPYPHHEHYAEKGRTGSGAADFAPSRVYAADR
jgi:hypothetical protein